MQQESMSEIGKSKTHEDILKEKYRDTITCFLKDNTLYDCLSHNNQVVVLDQAFSCLDVLSIFTEQNLESALFWNSDISNYDGVFTHSDLIKVILKFYRNACLGVKSYFDYPFEYKLSQIEEESENMDEQSMPSPMKSQSDIGFLDHVITETQLAKFYLDLKTINIRQWYSIINDESDMTTVTGLIKSKMEERLNDTCIKLVRAGESQMVMGTISEKDILVFLIKGFTQYFGEIYKSTKFDVTQPQHLLQMKHFYMNTSDLEAEERIFSLRQDQSVYMAFYMMVYTYKSRSIPIVNEFNKYIGSISRRDITFIIKSNQYQMLSWPIHKFIAHLSPIKPHIAAYHFLRQEKFTLDQTVKEVVENLVLSESNSLTCTDDNQNIAHIINISDIFAFLLGEI